jgi:hypothetical protein
VAIAQQKPDLVVNISRKACDIFEFHRAAEMIEYGKIQLDKTLEAKGIDL